MSKKIEKKKRKIQERIESLQKDLTLSLTKKDSSTDEISVGEYQRKIEQLNHQLLKL